VPISTDWGFFMKECAGNHIIQCHFSGSPKQQLPQTPALGICSLPVRPTAALAAAAGEEAGVGVRSGAFEVDLPRRQLRPSYWPGTCHRVLRGTWFAEKGGEWVPLKARLSQHQSAHWRLHILYSLPPPPGRQLCVHN
jgi:hypothetical protein